MIFQTLSASVTFCLVMVAGMWLMAQIEPPGGRAVRIVILFAIVAVALAFALVTFQGGPPSEELY